MSCLACTGGILKCSMGTAPGTLSPLNKKIMCPVPMSNITDVSPMVAMPAFGLCKTLTAIATAMATIAAMGVYTYVPIPCIPMVSTWVTATPTILVAGSPAITLEATASCNLGGGTITPLFPGQAVVMSA